MVDVESVVFEMWDFSEEEIIQEVMDRFLLGYSEAFERVRLILEKESQVNDD